MTPAPDSAAVLVGGAGRRMGADKAGVLLGGRPLVQWVVDAVGQVVPDVFLVGRKGQANPLPSHRFVTDGHGERASLVGVAAALAGAESERVLVVGCDQPFLVPGLLSRLLAGARSSAACAPMRAGRPEPLLAAWRPEVALPVLERRIEAGDLRLSSALRELGPAWIEMPEIDRCDPEGLSFLNVNDPADLARAQALVEMLGS